MRALFKIEVGVSSFTERSSQKVRKQWPCSPRINFRVYVCLLRLWCTDRVILVHPSSGQHTRVDVSLSRTGKPKDVACSV